MDTTQVTEQKVKAQLDKFDAQITEMKAKAAQSKAEAKVNYYEKIEELQTQRDSIGKQLEEFKASSESAWEDIQEGIEGAVGRLQKSFEKAASHFN
ncbi:MAG: hypothetical protein AAF685_02980 [Cyanobacteria bacterium P01_C01_bin.89]